MANNLLGSAALLWGWLRSALERRRRLDDPEFRRALRAYQRCVLLVGKKRALEKIHGITTMEVAR
jgi:hypothetical protein